MADESVTPYPQPAGFDPYPTDEEAADDNANRDAVDPADRNVQLVDPGDSVSPGLVGDTEMHDKVAEVGEEVADTEGFDTSPPFAPFDTSSTRVGNAYGLSPDAAQNFHDELRVQAENYRKLADEADAKADEYTEFLPTDAEDGDGDADDTTSGTSEEVV